MVKIKCSNKVFYNNSDNYRYIVTTYSNGYQIVKVIAPYRGCWKQKSTLKGFNISVV